MLFVGKKIFSLSHLSASLPPPYAGIWPSRLKFICKLRKGGRERGKLGSKQRKQDDP